MVVIEQLAAKFQIQLVAELCNSVPDMLGLQLQIFFVIKSDRNENLLPLFTAFLFFVRFHPPDSHPVRHLKIINKNSIPQKSCRFTLWNPFFHPEQQFFPISLFLYQIAHFVACSMPFRVINWNKKGA